MEIDMDNLQAQVDELKREILGVKTELQVLVHYLSTTRPVPDLPILGPQRWTAYQGDLKRALEEAGL